MDKDNNHDNLDNDLDGFDETPLNLTNEENKVGEEDAEQVANMQKEYEKFMNEMKNTT